MTESSEITARITERLRLLNITERDASLQVTDKPDMIRDIKRGRMPSAPRMQALADLLQVSVPWLINGEENPGPAPRLNPKKDVVGEHPLPFRPMELPRDVPVYGTALGHNLRFDDNGSVAVETTTFELGDVVDWLRRPPALAGRKDVYGLYVAGTSMSPRFEPGDPVYVDPRRPPSIGDYVIVQLLRTRQEEDGEIEMALIKRLVRRSTSFVELEQFEPQGSFKVEMTRVASIHRVLTIADLMAV